MHVTDLVIFSLIYFIVAIQLYNGFPPFYRKSGNEFGKKQVIDKEMESRIIRYVAAIISGVLLGVALVYWADRVEFLLIIALVFFYCGWSIRLDLKRKTGGPLNWVISFSWSPYVYPLIHRWPMILFDFWTIGVLGACWVLMMV